jgi:3-phenylpropionate/trans-cinnamate dioxygenase ferredoxin reductase subunit
LTLVGDERHLPYERPPLSKDAMTGEGPPTMKVIAQEQVLVAHAIRHMAGNAAVAIHPASRSVELANGEELRYDRLLLATGAVPRRLALTDSVDRAFYLRTFDDAQRIASRLDRGVRLAIVGGGFIGPNSPRRHSGEGLPSR